MDSLVDGLFEHGDKGPDALLAPLLPAPARTGLLGWQAATLAAALAATLANAALATADPSRLPLPLGGRLGRGRHWRPGGAPRVASTSEALGARGLGGAVSALTDGAGPLVGCLGEAQG